MADRHTRINRRSWLKATAGIVGLTGLGVGASAAASGDYDVVEVSPGGRYTVRLEDGETLENTLIDITASGATFTIRGVGNDWAIRNVGVRGVDDSDDCEFIVHGVDQGHEAVIENVYLGDGNVSDRKGQGRSVGIFVHPDHAGTLRLKNVNLQHWSDNGLYASAPGNPGSHTNAGGRGAVEVVDSYAAHNHVSGLRLGTNSSYCENCVMYNNQRGFWAYYENTELRNCDLLDNSSDINVGSYSSKGQRAEVTLTNTRYESITGGNAPAGVHGQSAGAPQHRIPEGVPTSPEEAASGGASGGSGAGSEDPEISDDAHLVAFISEEGSSHVTYDFAADGPVEFTEAGYESPSGGTIEGGTWTGKDFVEQDGETWTAGGGTGLGHGDAYLVDGQVTDVNLDVPEDMWIELDGEEVTPEELVAQTAPDEGSQPAERLVSFISTEDGEHVTYDFTAGGPVEFTEAGYESPTGGTIEGGTWSGKDFVEQDGETWTAGGGTGLGHGDAYLVEGPVLSVNLHAPEDMWIELDGEEVTPEELVAQTAPDDGSDDGDGGDDGGDGGDGGDDGGLSNTIVIDGTGTGDVTRYTFTVSGEVEPDPELTTVAGDGMAWDSMQDVVSGNTVIGVVGEGTDGYRFSGEITSQDVRGDASVNVEADQ